MANMDIPDETLVTENVVYVCDSEAPRFRVAPGEIYAEVFEKTASNFARHAGTLRNPTGFLHKTARFESRRACRRARSEMLNTLPELDGFAGTHGFERTSRSSVVDLLIHREEVEEHRKRAEAVWAVFCGLPASQQEALVVVTGAQGCEFAATDLPKTVGGLAKLRGCSRQHIYNLYAKARRAIRASVSIREGKNAD